MASKGMSSGTRWILVVVVASCLGVGSLAALLLLAAVSIDDPIQWAFCSTSPPPPPGDPSDIDALAAILPVLVERGEVTMPADQLEPVLRSLLEAGGARAVIEGDVIDAVVWIPCATEEGWMRFATRGRYAVADGRVVIAEPEQLDIGPYPFAWLGPEDTKEMLDDSLREVAAEDPLAAAIDDIWFADGALGLRLTAEGHAQLRAWGAEQGL